MCVYVTVCVCAHNCANFSNIILCLQEQIQEENPKDAPRRLQSTLLDVIVSFFFFF